MIIMVKNVSSDVFIFSPFYLSKARNERNFKLLSYERRVIITITIKKTVYVNFRDETKINKFNEILKWIINDKRIFFLSSKLPAKYLYCHFFRIPARSYYILVNFSVSVKQKKELFSWSLWLSFFWFKFFSNFKQGFATRGDVSAWIFNTHVMKH